MVLYQHLYKKIIVFQQPNYRPKIALHSALFINGT